MKRTKKHSFQQLFVFLLTLCMAMTTMQTTAQNTDTDSTTVLQNDSNTIRKKGLVGKLMQYLAESDKPDPNKKIDFGIIGGPHYDNETGLGLGIVASATYSADRSDSLLERSNASLYGDITTKAFMMVGLSGNHFFPKRHFRLDYTLYAYTFPSYLWGLSYPQSDNDDNKSKYSHDKLEVMTRLLARLNRYSYVGPIVRYQLVHAYKLKDRAPQLLEGQPMTVNDIGVGLSYTLDSRDFILNASKGWFLQFDLMTSPTMLGNKHTYYSAELQLATYRKAWRGAIIAAEIHTRQTTGEVPWSSLSEVGSGSRMRGYYEGRYRDKNVIDAQIELRQHVWHRNGIVVWLGAAEVFPRYSEMRLNRILPNAGIGYRWQFKKGVNVRLDYGFSRNGTGFIFNINEAF